MTNSPLTDLTVAQLKRAIAIKERIGRLEKELGLLLGRSESDSIHRTIGRGRRKMSRAARAKIAAAARARWAKVRAAKTK